ncbi:hypothetical protein F0562_035377 [Nyssa sinensis]|uniref:Uncharacterized protein n=1 Tax=Nyssa sinensis TaxID=561372 RepID=A0A5J5ABW5_9ASTE|nr:hypothetical protein F0562_035377 [Nyssa sinensis]
MEQRMDISDAGYDREKKTIDGVRKFHEQNLEAKKEYYSPDRTKTVTFSTSSDLFISRTAALRDTLAISLRSSDHLDPTELPSTCRDPSRV